METEHVPTMSCASLLGYGKSTHKRFGGICQYCGLGKNGVDFNLWRQLSVDHVIPGRLFPGDGKKLSSIFPRIPRKQLKNLSEIINEINLVTACNFCNSMTSRMGKNDGIDVEKVRNILPSDNCEEVASIDDMRVRLMLSRLEDCVDEILPIKRMYVHRKLAGLRVEFEKTIRPHMQPEESIYP